MAFWTDSTGQDPKRQYRFLVVIGNYPEGATWYAKKVDKPAFAVTEAKHNYLNHTFYYPGRVEWQEVGVTLVDPVSPDAVANTLAIVQASGYKPPSNFTETTTMSKAASIASLGGVVVQMIDHAGNAIETWTLNGAWIKDAKFGTLDYSGDDLIEIELKFRYDWADCVTAANAEVAVPGAPQNDFFKMGTSS